MIRWRQRGSGGEYLFEKALKLDEEVSELIRALVFRDMAQVREEMADVAIVLLDLAEQSETDLESEIDRKLEINEERLKNNRWGTLSEITEDVCTESKH